ncbi:hypothetical protein HZS_2853, partial [Henneguya salminicola]
MSSSIEHLIQVVNKLQDCFSALGSSCPIDLPQIAVVGEQSAGKSSVLENFVGKDFLPRGSGIVTRRPLILQLIHQEGEEYATFLHTRDKIFSDFLEVRREIELETDRATGSNKNISPIPINLRVFSPHESVLNLTLIDLPGLTKVPVGDQPKDIEQQIRSMLLTYITNPNCLILAVTPAIIDLANSEALKMAREVDPEGQRTIGVITKIDMMDQGTDCKEVLENRVYNLKRGYVGIVNRSQRDIEGKKDIRAAQDSEMQFFGSHHVYKHMADRMGSRFLQRTLNNQLSQHIKETLPSLKQKIQDEIDNLETTMGPMLHRAELDDTEKTKIFMTLIQDFSKKVDVVLGYQQEFVDTKELSGGSIINKILYQRLPYELEKVGRVKPEPTKARNELKIAIINSQGVRTSIFTPDVAFTSVVKKYIGETRSSCNRIAELVSSEVFKIVEKSGAENVLSVYLSKFGTYPDLLAEIMSFCQEKLSATVSEAKKHINLYVDAEHAHINTKHPDFVVFDGRENSEDDNGYKGVNRGHEHNIFKKGYMMMPSQGFLKSSKTEFFVLKGSSLTSYKDERVSEQKIQVHLDGCRIKDYETNYSSKKNCFQLYHKDGRMIGKDVKCLDVSCQNDDEAEEWKAAFLAAGVPTDRKKENNKDEANNTNEVDVHLLQKVELIYAYVMCYLQIVIKNEVDIISKICVKCIITTIRKCILADIVAQLMATKSVQQLMKESDELVSKRREMQQIYKSCKEAMTFIHSIMNTFGVELSAKKYPTMYKNMKDPFASPPGLEMSHSPKISISTHSNEQTSPKSI